MKIKAALSIFLLILAFFVGASFHKFKIFPFGLGLFSAILEVNSGDFEEKKKQRFRL